VLEHKVRLSKGYVAPVPLRAPQQRRPEGGTRGLKVSELEIFNGNMVTVHQRNVAPVTLQTNTPYTQKFYELLSKLPGNRKEMAQIQVKILKKDIFSFLKYLQDRVSSHTLSTRILYLHDHLHCDRVRGQDEPEQELSEQAILKLLLWVVSSTDSNTMEIIM